MFRNLLVPAASLSILPFVGAAFAQTGEVPRGDNFYRHGSGMMWGSEYLGGFGFILGPIFMILVLGLLVFGILYLLRAMGVMRLGPNGGVQQQDPLALLRERYARGEIDTKEFEERRRILTQ